MRTPKLEISDPGQWLRQLSEESGGFRRLVSDSNGLARAAFRLARARCSVDSGEPPSLADLQAATAFLGARLGVPDVLPIQSLLPGTGAPSRVPAGASELPTVAHSLPPPAPSSRRRKSSPHPATRSDYIGPTPAR